MDRFQRDLRERNFLFTFELVPGRSIRTREFQSILDFIEKAPDFNLFSGFSITDNAGGHPALSPVALGRIIKKLNLSAIIHLTCKDKNRNQLESELLALDRENLHNLLVLTGDYPFYGYQGRAKPVFDLDSVLLLQLITEMERGIEIPRGAPGGGNRLPPIPFFKGCAVTPFKLDPSELWWQYVKLYRKLKAGARFVITQVGFSPEPLLHLKKVLERGFTNFLAEKLEDERLYQPEEDQKFAQIPVLVSLLFLPGPVLKTLLQGRVPGILLGKKVWEGLIHSINPTQAAIEICAKLAVIYQKMGFKGVHLCGFPPSWETILRFLDRFSYYSSQALEDLSSEFDATVVYEVNGKVFERPLASLDQPWPHPSYSWSYLLNQLVHGVFFSVTSPLYPLLFRFFRWASQKKSRAHLLTRFEYALKKPLFFCQECGDCTLWEFNYLCPQSQCPKSLLNGPCGGSFAGSCEVYPFRRRCFYVRVLQRGPLKTTLRRFLSPKNHYLPPRDWSLFQTSSWLNFYLKKGHFRHEG